VKVVVSEFLKSLNDMRSGILKGNVGHDTDGSDSGGDLQGVHLCCTPLFSKEEQIGTYWYSLFDVKGTVPCFSWNEEILPLLLRGE